MSQAPEPTPEEERAIAELLADASASWQAPLPDGVIERLDVTLAGLVAEREAPAPSVVPIRSRRSRRWPRALLAAAAVLAGGFAVGNVVERSAVTSDADSAGAESTADLEAGDGAELDDGGAGASEDGRDAPAEILPEALSDKDSLDRVTSQHGFLDAGEPVRLRSDRLDRDVRRVLASLDRAELDSGAATADEPPCAEPSPAGDGVWLVARYDDERASLVLTEGPAGTVVGRVFDCADAVLLDRVVVD